MKRVRGFLWHVGVICSFVCMIAKALDYLNPFMDFTGHVWFVQTALYLVVITLALIKGPRKRTL